MVVQAGGAVDPESRTEHSIGIEEVALGAIFLRATRNILEAHSLEALELLILQGRFEEALVRLNESAALIANQFSDSFSAGARRTARFLSESVLTSPISFDQLNRFSVEAMARNRLRLIREFTEEQRLATRAALVDGIARNLNPRDAAINFRRSIGLTQRQQQSVENFRRLLTEGRRGGLPSETALNRSLRDARFDRTILRSIRENRPLSDAQVENMVQRYRNRFIRYRSEVIARTESQRAVHAGTLDMYSQAVEAGQINRGAVEHKWVTAQDESVRSSHRRLHGLVRMMGETWPGDDGPLRYPGDEEAPASETVGCRCILTTRIDSN